MIYFERQRETKFCAKRMVLILTNQKDLFTGEKE